MKIAVTCQNTAQNEGGENGDTSLRRPVDPRFGRAAGFIIFDMENGRTEFIDNSKNCDSAQGAGIQAAKTVINAGAKTLITGNVGPKAFSALNAGGVDIYLTEGGTVWDAIEDYRSGLLKKGSEANVEGHW